MVRLNQRRLGSSSKHLRQNCGKRLKTENELSRNDDEHGWSCDECHLCLTFKYEYDLHKPKELHPINDHTKHSTMKLFAEGNRQR